MKGFKAYQRMMEEGGLRPGQQIRVSGRYSGMERTFTYRVVDTDTLGPIMDKANLTHLGANYNPRKALQGKDWEIINIPDASVP